MDPNSRETQQNVLAEEEKEALWRLLAVGLQLSDELTRAEGLQFQDGSLMGLSDLFNPQYPIWSFDHCQE